MRDESRSAGAAQTPPPITIQSLIWSPRELPPRVPLQLSPNAITVLEKRYLLRDEAGSRSRQQRIFGRVARTVAEPDLAYGASEGAVEALAEAFCELMARRLFMPNSPTLMNAGRPLGQLSACFVLPVDDALSNGHSGIYDTLTSMALVHQSGGGTGFSFSKLRPRNDIVRSTMGVASGPVSFMSLFDASTDVVKQEAPAGAPTWASSGWTTPIFSTSSPARTTRPRSPISISRSRSPMRS